MDSIDWLRIQKNWMTLLKILDIEHVLPFLYQERVISDNEKEMIENEDLSFRQRDKLLTTLRKKENGYSKLCEVLRQQQPIIVQKLDQTIIDDDDYEKLRIHDKLASVLLDHFCEDKDSSVDLNDILLAIEKGLGQDVEKGFLIKTVCETFVNVNHKYDHGMHRFFNLKKRKSASVQEPISNHEKRLQKAKESSMSRSSISQDLESQRIPTSGKFTDKFTVDRITEEESPKEYCNMTLKIIKKSKNVRSYCIDGDGSKKTTAYFDLIGANSQMGCNIRCYISRYFDSIYNDLTYTFTNLIKSGNEFLLTRECVFHYTASIDIPKELLKKLPILPEDASDDGIYRSLRDAASWHAAPSLIKGKIIAISPLRYLHDDKLAILSLQLKDSSGLEKVTLFQDNAKLHLKENDIVQITQVYHKTYKGKSYLSTKPDSLCQVIHDTTLSNLRVDENDYPQDDDDFKENEDKRQNIVVNEFRDVNIYLCCSARGCRKIKMTENGCPKCGESATGLSCVVQFLFRFGNNHEEDIFVFEDNLQKILDEDLSLLSKETLIRQICQKLPLKFSCVMKGKDISKVQAKRGVEVL